MGARSRQLRQRDHVLELRELLAVQGSEGALEVRGAGRAAFRMRYGGADTDPRSGRKAPQSRGAGDHTASTACAGVRELTARAEIDAYQSIDRSLETLLRPLKVQRAYKPPRHASSSKLSQEW